MLQVSNVLTPININFGVLGSFLVILFSDYLKYKPVMMFCCLMGVLAYGCLIKSNATIVLMVRRQNTKNSIIFPLLMFVVYVFNKRFDATACILVATRRKSSYRVASRFFLWVGTSQLHTNQTGKITRTQN